MEEMRIKKLEIAVHTLNRRFDDHDELHVQDTAWKEKTTEDIGMLQRILQENQKQTAILIKVAPSIDNMAHYLEKTYDVVTPLAKFSGYMLKIMALCGAIWAGASWLLHKAAALKLSGW